VGRPDRREVVARRGEGLLRERVDVALEHVDGDRGDVTEVRRDRDRVGSGPVQQCGVVVVPGRLLALRPEGPEEPLDRLPVGAGSDADDLEVRASSDPLGDVVDVAGRADDPDPGHGRPSVTGVKPFPDATAPTAAVDTRRRCQSRSNGGSTG